MTASYFSNIKFIGDFLSKIAEKSETVYWLSSPDFKKIVYISPAYEKIWGRPREILYKNPELWITYLLPEDVQSYHPIHQMAEKIANQGPDARYDEKYRIVRPDGEIRWIIDRGFPIYKNGKCQGVTGVAIDITNEKRYEQELQEAKLKAEKANEAKTYFLATMSHELRTPLNGILGMAQVLNLTKMTNEQKEYVDDITRSGQHLLSLIGNILDFSKLETGYSEIYAAPTDLKVIVEETTSLLSYQAREKNIDLHIIYPPSLPHLVITDSRVIRQILINLVGNAIKFTERGFVIVRVRCSEICKNSAKFIISVSDQGIGIASNHINLIFDRFTQVDSSYTRNYGGTGLGLAITKKLVELLGGTIQVKSKLDTGSVFTVTLRLDLQNYQTIESAWDKYKNTVKILIIDDTEGGHVIAKHLESANVEVVKSEHAINFFTSAQQQVSPFDILMINDQLNNIQMPTLIKKMKSCRKVKTPLLILISHPTKKVTKKHAEEYGFFDCIIKPVKPRELLTKITAAWEKWLSLADD